MDAVLPARMMRRLVRGRAPSLTAFCTSHVASACWPATSSALLACRTTARAPVRPSRRLRSPPRTPYSWFHVIHLLVSLRRTHTTNTHTRAQRLLGHTQHGRLWQTCLRIQPSSDLFVHIWRDGRVRERESRAHSHRAARQRSRRGGGRGRRRERLLREELARGPARSVLHVESTMSPPSFCVVGRQCYDTSTDTAHTH